MLPEAITFFGITIPVTLMGAIIVIAIVTGAYITFGGQTAVIFTDLLQGFILLFAGFMLFFLGISYLGGFEIFWGLLPVEWKLPLADFNQPPNFNFVGIFWQDAIAGSIGFLFMNQGLIMRFMACKNVNEGRKAAAVNILFCYLFLQSSWGTLVGSEKLFPLLLLLLLPPIHRQTRSL